MAKKRRARKFVARGSDVAKAIPFIRAARVDAGLTQAELARRMKVTQSRVSKFERNGHTKLAAIAAYFKALGGELEIRISFPEGVSS